MKPEIQQIILRQAEHKLPLLLALRDEMLAADPSITEGLKSGRITFFSGENAIAFLCSKAETDYTELGFFKATSLRDPKKLFTGNGKGSGRLRIYTGDKIPGTQIRKWVREAVNLNKRK